MNEIRNDAVKIAQTIPLVKRIVLIATNMIWKYDVRNSFMIFQLLGYDRLNYERRNVHGKEYLILLAFLPMK